MGTDPQSEGHLLRHAKWLWRSLTSNFSFLNIHQRLNRQSWCHLLHLKLMLCILHFEVILAILSWKSGWTFWYRNHQKFWLASTCFRHRLFGICQGSAVDNQAGIRDGGWSHHKVHPTWKRSGTPISICILFQMHTPVAIALTCLNSLTFAHCKHVFVLVGNLQLFVHWTLLYTCFCWGNMVASTLGLALAIGCKCIRALSLCSGCRSPQLSSSTRWKQMDLLDMSEMCRKIPWINAVFRTQEQAHAEVLWAWILFWDRADIDIHKDPVAYIWRLTAWKIALPQVNA